LEVKKFLSKKLGQVARDPAAAQAQYQEQLQLGQDQLARENAQSAINDELEARRRGVQRNKSIVKYGAAVGAGAGLLPVAKQVVKNLVP
jgi:hypothetical protein